MRFIWSLRRACALLTLICLGFAQIAVAAHACTTTGASMSTMRMTTNDGTQFLPPCDNGLSNLCFKHCQSDQQNVDQQLSVMLLPNAYPHALTLQVREQSEPAVPLTPVSLLARATAPPLSIQYCTFRT